MENDNKYPISAMYKLLNIPKSSLCYAKNNLLNDDRNPKGKELSMKIKRELAKQNLTVSRLKICRIMKEDGLVFSSTVKQFKLHKQTCNNAPINNELNQNFNQEKRMNAVVSDLTYVNVDGKWNYISTWSYVNISD